MSRVQTFNNFIGGFWDSAMSEKTFENRNPADTRELLGRFPDSSSEDVHLAVTAARKAFPAWSQTPPLVRGHILGKTRQILRAQKEELSVIQTREMGKPLSETRGDIQEAIDVAALAISHLHQPSGYMVRLEQPGWEGTAERVGIGVAGVICPWNFPTAIPALKTFFALACGNTVVLKPAKDTPESASRLAQALDTAGLPMGVFNLVHGGDGPGKALVSHPEVDLISFTGSTATGHKVNEAAAKSSNHKFKRVAVETGGNNAMIVMADANLENAAEDAVWGAFKTTGQRCSATRRLIVHEDVLEPFSSLLVDKAERLKVGNGLKEGVDIGPLINFEAREKVKEYITLGASEGKILMGGKVPKGKEYDHGYFYQPTIISGIKPNSRLAQEEIFGPVTVLIPFRNFDVAIAIANGTNYGLTSAIYTENHRTAMKGRDRLESGVVYINHSTIGADIHLPFGGIKGSGNFHPEGSWTAPDFYSRWKVTYNNYK